MRIAILVHGRFYAFDLARELIRRGHDLTLFTNYPSFVAERYGIPARHVRSFLPHGIGSRVLQRIFPMGLNGRLDQWLHTAFGRWAAAGVSAKEWDVVFGFSGICEEPFRALHGSRTLKVVTRASSHISVQRRLLEREEARAGVWVDKPSSWMVEREKREYAGADLIVVLSDFSFQTFRECGFPVGRLAQLRLGVQTSRFRAPAEVGRARQARILSGGPLNVLNVGTFCIRKGALDFVAAIRMLESSRFRFRFVGAVASDARQLREDLGRQADFTGKVPEADLPEVYRTADLFVLPTIEDGFPVVLTQALACGLPVVTTANCSGPDIIRPDSTGWLIPAQQPAALAERLRWCDTHRSELAAAALAAQNSWRDVDWTETATRWEAVVQDALAAAAASAKIRRP